MDKAIKSITDTVKESSKDFSEVLKERIFSPMYFYFIIAWIITNWQFTYSFLFIEQDFLYDKKAFLKTEYLNGFYDFSSFLSGLWSVSQLIIIPIFSTWFVVWILSKASEKFYKKTEEHKINKRKIKKLLEYSEKVEYYEEQRSIRLAQADRNKIRYEDSDEFNEILDTANGETLEVAGILLRPSRVLYENDYESYKEQYQSWETHRGE